MFQNKPNSQQKPKNKLTENLSPPLPILDEAAEDQTEPMEQAGSSQKFTFVHPLNKTNQVSISTTKSG